MPKLTLAEIAAQYRKTPKTFSRHVAKLGIPHDLIGRSMLFNPAEVEAHFLKLRQSNNVIQIRPNLPAKRKRSKVTFKSKCLEALR